MESIGALFFLPDKKMLFTCAESLPATPIDLEFIHPFNQSFSNSLLNKTVCQTELGARSTMVNNKNDTIPARLISTTINHIFINLI